MTEEEIATAEVSAVEGLSDINPTDRVFSALDRFVKVRVLPIEVTIGRTVLEFSGAEADAAGAALPDGAGGFQIAEAWRETYQSDQVGDVAAMVAASRIECVRKTLRAIAVRDATLAAL